MTRPDEIASMADVARLGDQAKARAGFADWRIASAGYFKAMSIPLVRGRLFEESDGPDAPHVAVISESLARAKWPDQDPIGRFIQFGNMDGDLRGFRVIGVVGDVRELSPESVPSSTFYAHYRQRLSSRISVVARRPRRRRWRRRRGAWPWTSNPTCRCRSAPSTTRSTAPSPAAASASC